jgi:hypothetical protein
MIKGKKTFTAIEEQIVEQENGLMLLFKNMLNAFVLYRSVFDDEGKFISCKYAYVNDAYEKIIGINKDDITGKTVHEVYPETELEWIEKYGNVAVTGHPACFKMVFKQAAKTYNCNVYRPFDSNELFCVLLEDLTEEQKAKELLIQQNIKYASSKEAYRSTIKKLEKANRDAEEKVARLVCVFDDSPIGKSMTDIDGTIRTNKAFSDMLGYSLEEFQLKNWREISYPDDIELSKNVNEELLKNKKTSIQFEKRYIHKNGAIIFADVTATLIKGEMGAPLFFVTSILDITERKKAEQTLMNRNEELQKAKDRADESNRFASLITEQSPDIIYVYDILKNKNIFINKNLRELLGYKKGTVPEENLELIDRLIHPDDKNQFYEYDDLIKNWDTEYVYQSEYRLKAADGNWKWFFGREKEFERKNNKILSLIGVVTDITEYKKVELELIAAKQKAEENEERLYAYINSIPDVICYKDGMGRWLLANDADLELFCLTGFNYFGKTDIELAEYTHALYKNAFINCIESDEEAWNKKTISQGIEIIPTVKGKSKVYDVFKIPLFYPNSERKGLAVIGRDITKLFETQQNLILAKEKAEESDKLKSAFLANMSHEIRTPMNGILGFSALLNEPGLNSEEQQTYIQFIQKSGARMLNIISEIIDISKIESGQTEIFIKEVNIKKTIEDIYNLFKSDAEAKGLNFSFNYDQLISGEIFYTDGEKLYTILSNLVKNAIKYTDEGSIEFGYNPIETLHEISLLQFYVKDTGIGIRKERQEAIFERFIQADIGDVQARQGAGLGLAIAKSYVEMLGGGIWVESEPAKGSAFYFTLINQTKLAEIRCAENLILADDRQILKRKLKILIVEDDEISDFFLTKIISNISNEILHAASGIEAVKICLNNPDIDLVLMDIKMPDLNGCEATRQVRQFNPNVVIIAQTAYGLSGDKEIVLEAGCNDYISKPIKKDELIFLIQKYTK